MLGYDAYVHEIRPCVSEEDVRRIAQFQYKERMSYLATLTSRRVAHVPCRTWVDKLLNVADDGRVRMLHDGGYPYLFHASGKEIKANFATAGVGAIATLSDATWYLVEAWDQS